VGSGIILHHHVIQSSLSNHVVRLATFLALGIHLCPARSRQSKILHLAKRQLAAQCSAMYHFETGTPVILSV
jgi:hypothetical protein